MSRISNGRDTVVPTLPKMRHAAYQGPHHDALIENSGLIKRNLEDPQGFFDWLTYKPGMEWDVLNVRKYKRPLYMADMIEGANPSYCYIISSSKGYNVQLDREKGTMRIYYPNGGDELEEGADAGEFHIICF